MIKAPKLIATLFTSLFFISASFSQSYNQRINEYISQYKDFAIAEMMRSGIPASVTLAQGILETSGGQSDLASMANNHFGIKCKSTWTGETMSHDDDEKNECFRKYSSAEDSYKDHSDFLMSKPCYAFLFKLDPTDYEGWAKGLKKAGYATSPTYSQKLIKLIVENNLQEYTLLGMQSIEGQEKVLVSNNNIEENIIQPSDNPGIKKVIIPLADTNPVEMKTTKQYPAHAVFNINEAKVVYAESGVSLLALANNYNLSYKKLLEFNDLDQTDILNYSQLIFLEKKSKKGIKEVHIVKPKESLHDIAQSEGVQLSSIMEYNGLQKNMQPAPGEKIYLQYPSPSAPKIASSIVFTSSQSM